MRIGIVVLIAFIGLFDKVCADAGQPVTIIVAADMPNISEPVSGRYAELKTLVDNYKNTRDDVFFVFGGGSIGPSALSTFDRGSHIIDLLNSLEPDVMGVTKREFSYFEDELSLRAYEAAFPLVASNIQDARIQRVIDGLATTALIKKSNVSLGVISLLHERIIDEYLLANIAVDEPVRSVREHAQELREQGADVVLLHYSYPFEFVTDLLEENVINIAFVSDARLFEKYQSEIITHPRMLSLKAPGVALVGTFSIADKTTLIREKEYVLSRLSADSRIKRQVESYQSRLNRLLDIQVGVWKSDITTAREAVRGEENAFANFVTDTMREYANADMALINGGSIRGDTFYAKGSPVTRRHIASELPFKNYLTTLDITGQQFVQSLEHGLSQLENLKGGFLHVSGARVRFDSTKPEGQRVVSVMIKDKALEATKNYTLATTDFIANGGDGLASLSSAVKIDNNTLVTPTIADLVTQVVINSRSIESATEQRIVDVARGR